MTAASGALATDRADGENGPLPSPVSRKIRLRLLRSDVVVVVFAAACALARYRMLVAQGAPVGVDGGNWLAFARTLLGQELRSDSIVYPPLVPLVVWSATKLLGYVHGFALVAAAASVAPAAGVYSVLRRRAGDRVVRAGAVALAALIAGASSVGEAAAWGGYPQLLGLGFAIPAVDCVAEYLETGQGRRRAALLVGATACTSHLVFAATVCSLLLLFVHRLAVPVRAGTGAGRGALVRRLSFVLAVPVLLLPVYAVLIAETVSGGGATAEGPGAVFAAAATLYPDLSWFWPSVLVAGFLGPWLLAGTVPRREWTVPASLTLTIAGALVLTREVRLWYLAQPVAVVGLMVWIEALRAVASRHLRRAAVVAVGVLAAASCVQAVAATVHFERQRDFYSTLTPASTRALVDLRAHVEPSDVVAVSPQRGWPQGWWVEGITGTRTLYASQLRWLTFSDERSRADVANRIYARGIPDADGVRLARSHGVTHLLLLRDWSGYLPATAERLLAQPDVRVVLQTDGVLVVSI